MTLASPDSLLKHLVYSNSTIVLKGSNVTHIHHVSCQPPRGIVFPSLAASKDRRRFTAPSTSTRRRAGALRPKRREGYYTFHSKYFEHCEAGF